MGTLTAQINRIREKLATVRGRQIDTFGASSHQYELGPALDEARVRAFEVEHGVTLPDGYRAFITELGHGGQGPHGGAGPYYGLYSLDEWDDFVTWIADEVPLDWLSRPSPLRPGPNPLPEVEAADDDGDWPSEEVLAMYNGMLTLGTRGCTYMIGLIVSGEARGRVVYVDAEQEERYVGRDADFLDWYERWLDELIDGYQSSWFGYGPAGDEATLLDIISNDSAPDLTREAINNLHKLPERTDAVWQMITRRVDDDSPHVRAAAINLLVKSGRAQDVATIASRWDDDDAQVRGVVIRALLGLEPERWVDSAYEAFWSDEAVRRDAFDALRQHDLFTNEQLLAIIADQELADFRVRAIYFVKWAKEHAEILFELLSEEDATARREAANALTKLELAPDDERLLDALQTEPDDYAQAALIRLVVATEERRAAVRLLEIAGSAGHDFQRLAAVDALCKLGDDKVMPIAEEMLTIDRTPVAPGRGDTRTIAELVRDGLESSPSPTLRALGKVV